VVAQAVVYRDAAGARANQGGHQVEVSAVLRCKVRRDRAHSGGNLHRDVVVVDAIVQVAEVDDARETLAPV